jgi:glycerophosphoryl diester phosphodiesterase
VDKKQIYAHRGMWRNSILPNSIEALETALNHGFSLETDFRVRQNMLVIAHDTNDTDPQVDFQQLFLTSVAINIKEDGLISFFRGWEEEIVNSNSFFFDGSIPEMYRFHKASLPHALRLSEYEQELPWKSPVIWLDSFESDWWIKREGIFELLTTSKVVVVSPELHKRDHRKVWDLVLERMQRGQENLSICTDFPEEFLRELNA